MWDFGKLPACDGETITGIRLGFRKEDFKTAKGTMRLIQEKGYKLFMQMVETRDYTDLEYVTTLKAVNEVKPFAVGIVDTFGTMYKDDLARIYTLADHNLDDEITIDFHSHNNMQLSFSFAQEIIEMSRGKRKIMLDATLSGMGKGAGNLNTELIVECLNSRYGYTYDFDCILDTIDQHIPWIAKENAWGYSIPSLMSGIFSSHPNNVDYLLKQNRLATNDIRYILSMVDAKTRKRYDYDNIDRLYLEYSSSTYDDRKSLALLKDALKEKTALVVVFGATSRTYKEDVLRFIREKAPVVFSVNHIYPEYEPDFAFFGNHRRYRNLTTEDLSVRRVVTSNLSSEHAGDIVVNCNKVISVGYPNYDNSTIMLLNLLRNLGVEDIALAGLDGFSAEARENYANVILSHNEFSEKEADARNEQLKALLRHFAETLKDRRSVRFVTPSRFAPVFEA